jgi:hypothetical protein
MRVDSVITLDNDVNCLLLEKAVLNDDNYFMAVVLDEREEPSDEYVIFKEVLENGEKYVLKVEDESTLNELLKSFTKSFNQMVNNLPIED